MMKMNLLTRVISIALITLGVCAQAHAERYAYVDVARAVTEVEDGKAAKARLEAMIKERQQALNTKEKEFQQLKDSFDKQAQFMTPEVRQQKEEELQKMYINLQQMLAQLRQEVAAEDAKIKRQIFGRMGEVLKAIGEESSYSMIVQKEALLWAPSHLDITNELIRRYNKYLSEQKGAKPKTKTKAKAKSKRRKRKRRSKSSK